ncbi:hypothetical protein MTBBW1_610001 [Desulfamplus magnetovallimortis]|uniref:Uncharacterized protein n=1 Tax=Desulfamplus magnetovallimortis TaxID=1246637 RepID=A0A1W1HIE4_9BACT|nr:hypothetical protein MTBBW1_610001 [Desulfamplus magnetovallimortis]
MGSSVGLNLLFARFERVLRLMPVNGHGRHSGTPEYRNLYLFPR